MTVEQKVGQTIQADISAISPADLERFGPQPHELAATLIGEAQTRGDVSWWAVANDPLIFDYAETSVEATAFSRAPAREVSGSLVTSKHRLGC